jgi:hypothetical protein
MSNTFPFPQLNLRGVTYGILEKNDMNVGGKDFVGDWVVHHSFRILTLALSRQMEEVATYLEEV